MANPYDQFDPNPYDRFDAPKARPKAQPAPARNPGTGIGWLDQTLSSVNEALIGAPEAVYNAAAFVTDPISGMIFGQKALKEAQTQRKNFVDSVSRAVVSRPSPVARTTGRIAGTIPLGMIKAPAAATSMFPRLVPIAARAAQGAVGGAAVRDQGTDAAAPAAIGAAANVVLPPIVGKTLNYLGGTRPVQYLADKAAPLATKAGGALSGLLDDAYNAVGPRIGMAPIPPAVARPVIPPASAKPVAEQFGKAAQVRLDNFRKVGVQAPTTGMVTRDPKAWTFERETQKIAGVGDDLTQQLQNVSKDLDNAAKRLVNPRGPVDPEATGAMVQKALDAKRNEMQAVTSRLYTHVRETKGDIPAGDLQGFRKALEDPDILDNPTFDAMRDGIMRRMQRFGMAGHGGILREGSVATVSQAEQLRRFVGALGDTKDPAVRYMRGKLIDSLDEDVVNTLGDDAFKAARASARQRFAEFQKTYAGRLADAAVPPEQMATHIFRPSTSLADVRALKRSLFTGTPEQVTRGTEAWNKLGGRALEDLIEKSRVNDNISGAAIRKNFAKSAPKLRELLEPAEFKQLQRFVAAAHDATAAVPLSAVNYSNTASAAANMFADPANPAGRSIVKGILRHLAAYAGLGPPGNVALVVGDKLATDAAARQATADLSRRAAMAANPQAAAMAARATAEQALRDQAVRSIADRGKNLPGQAPGLLPALLTPDGSRR